MEQKNDDNDDLNGYVIPSGKFCWYNNCPVKTKTNTRFKFPKYTQEYKSREEYDDKLSKWVHHCGSDEVMWMYLRKKPALHEFRICSLHFRTEHMYYNGRSLKLHLHAVPIDYKNPQTESLALMPRVPNILSSSKTEVSTSNSQDPTLDAEKSELSSAAGLPLSPSNNERPDITRQTETSNLAANDVLVDSAGFKVASSSMTSRTCTEHHIIASTDGQDREVIIVPLTDVTSKINGFHGFSSLIETETDLREFCGISINSLKLLLSLLPKLKTYVSTHLSPVDCLLSFLLQMKTGNSFVLIKNLFCMNTVMEASDIFGNILFHMSMQMKQFIVWPDKQTVLKTIPDLFREDFVHCRVILYCLDIQLESPNQTSQSADWYSKSVQKILIGFTPSGAISFVSKAFPAKFTLMEVITDSKILDLLEPSDFAFLVFYDNYSDINWKLLHSFVKKNRISILLPSHYNNKIENNPTPQQTQIWAHAVSQIKRVKSYKILYNCSLEGCWVENIVFMACVLANLQPLQYPSSPA